MVVYSGCLLVTCVIFPDGLGVIGVPFELN